MKMVKVDPKDPDEKLISEAAGIVRNGGLVAFPTETVYGIAANLLDDKAIERLCRVKKRPADKKLTIHIADIRTLREMAGEITPYAEKLIESFWPGPLTIILNTKDGEKKGFRMPSNKIALSLIRKSGVPVVAPSANISGERPPSTATEVRDGLGDGIDMILDGGPTEVGMESTVVDATAFPCKVLRERAITAAEISQAFESLT